MQEDFILTSVEKGSQSVCGEFDWVRLLVVYSLYKTNPNPRKNILSGKKWPKCHLKPNFAWCWVGLGLGSSSVS